MSNEQKSELTPEQISLLLQIVNRQSFIGEQVEIVSELKKTLCGMLKSKQSYQLK